MSIHANFRDGVRHREAMVVDSTQGLDVEHVQHSINEGFAFELLKTFVNNDQPPPERSSLFQRICEVLHLNDEAIRGLWNHFPGEGILDIEKRWNQVEQMRETGQTINAISAPHLFPAKEQQAHTALPSLCKNACLVVGAMAIGIALTIILRK